MFKVRLYPLFEGDGEIGGSASEEGAFQDAENAESAPAQETSQETQQGEAQSTESESSFARRLREHSEKVLRAEREKWEKEQQEKYGDYETHKELSSYLQQINGLDAMTLKERIELERLQERADQANVPPEVLKRIDELEAKAAKADELEQQQQEEQRVQSYFNTLGEFVKDKGIEAEKLNQFMIENDLTYDPNNPEKSFTIAYKAMKHDELQQMLPKAKEEGIKEYLASKQAPRVEGGSGSAGMQQLAPAKTMQEAEQRAIERLRAANNPT